MEGLNGADVLRFQEILIKSNTQQLKHLTRELITEIEKRIKQNDKRQEIYL